MTENTRTSESFHIGDLLSVTTGILLSPDHIGGVYRILNHLTGDNLMTHQLPKACDVARPHLLEQHPWLAGLTPGEGLSPGDVMAWVFARAAEHGEMHQVQPMPATAWGVHDPIADLMAMTDKPIVVVGMGRD